ncbi:hypothetical protein [Thiohalobacter sp.]|uniref:hypothetical protein n=1 Tax=Thiohalobacter sp. TaxID=2025948 RepID=UPI002630C5C3|nr:hypothetical protein [Thiohalobacter sp.]
MDHAVALVQAYLQLNGYFTVAEYPVIEAAGRRSYETATDLDMLAFRFPGAGRLVPGREDQPLFAPDPALGIDGSEADMLIGEVKEGHAELNRNARNPDVLRTVLARFGCCDLRHADHTVGELLHAGQAVTHSGHRVRLMAFGTSLPSPPPRHYAVLTLGHMIGFIEQYLDSYWPMLRHAQFKHPALGLLMVLEKARRAGR